MQIALPSPAAPDPLCRPLGRGLEFPIGGHSAAVVVVVVAAAGIEPVRTMPPLAASTWPLWLAFWLTPLLYCLSSLELLLLALWFACAEFAAFASAVVRAAAPVRLLAVGAVPGSAARPPLLHPLPAAAIRRILCRPFQCPGKIKVLYFTKTIN